MKETKHLHNSPKILFLSKIKNENGLRVATRFNNENNSAKFSQKLTEILKSQTHVKKQSKFRLTNY